MSHPENAPDGSVLVDSNAAQLQSRVSSITRMSNKGKEDDPFAPLILMSGYVVKRSRRGFGAKWQKRYWQLLGDGALIYFSGDHRLKVLGEIDIAHTCYEVRLGAENCDVKFPPVVSPSCCFSVAVLKRTYYFYTYTVKEAEKWVEALTSSSYLINRLRPRNLNYSPAVQVALKALKDNNSPAPPPPPPSTQPPPYHHKAPAPPPPPLAPSDSSDNDQTGSDAEEEESASSEEHDGHAELPVINKPHQITHRNMHSSVPDLRLAESSVINYPHNGSWIDGSPRIRSSTLSNTATPSPLTSTLTEQNPSHHPGERRRRKKVSYSPHFSDIADNSVQTTPTNNMRNRSKSVGLRQQYLSQGNLLGSNFDEDQNTSTLPSPAKLARMKQRWKSAYDVQWDPTFDKLEELQKQEDAIKKRIREMQKFESFSYLDLPKPAVLSPLSSHGAAVARNTSPFATTRTEQPYSLSQSYPEAPEQLSHSLSTATNNTTPTHFSQPVPDRTSASYAQQRNQYSDRMTPPSSMLKKPAPKVSPKPAMGRPRSKSLANPPATSSPIDNTIPAQIDTTNQQQPTPILPPPPPPPSTGSNNTVPPPVPPPPLTHPATTTTTAAPSTISNTIPTQEGPPALQYTETVSSKCVSEISLKENSEQKQSLQNNGGEINVWVKKEMIKLIEEIGKIGHYSVDGNFVVKFGLLLDKTEGVFEALLGTLLTARKYKVVDFEGEILLKGVNDDTLIILLKTEL